MKTVFLFLIILSSFSIFAQKGTLKIVVTNIKSNIGTINVVLYNEENKENFPKKSEFASEKTIVKVNNKKAAIIFNDLPYGTYAVSIFHDENSNGKIDRTFIGFPAEPFGISGDRFFIGPPKFKHGQFQISSPEKIIQIKVKSLL